MSIFPNFHPSLCELREVQTIQVKFLRWRRRCTRLAGPQESDDCSQLKNARISSGCMQTIAFRKAHRVVQDQSFCTKYRGILLLNSFPPVPSLAFVPVWRHLSIKINMRLKSLTIRAQGARLHDTTIENCYHADFSNWFTVRGGRLKSYRPLPSTNILCFHFVATK